MFKILLTMAVLSTSYMMARGQYLRYDPLPTITPPASLPLPSFPSQLPTYRRLPNQNQQDPSIIAFFKIKDGKEKGEDISKALAEANAAFIFYTEANVKGPQLCLNLPGRNSRSYGRISNFRQVDERPATVTSYRQTTTRFDWHFSNSYNTVTGVAAVTIIEEFKADEETFYCKVTLADDSYSEYWGVLVR